MMYDKENMMAVLENFPKQCKEAIKIAKKTKLKGSYKSVVVCGMGGSGIGGDILKSVADNIPIHPIHGYNLPSFVDKKTLVVIISYSGNTEETLSCYKEAKKKKLKILSITSGGKLAELEKDSVIIPSGLQPRNAIGYLFLTMVDILSRAKVIKNQSSAIKEMMNIVKPKKCSRKGFLIAQKLKGKIPVFYSSDMMYPAAYRIKTAVNENSKQPAFCHYFPELNHNEMNGLKKNYSKLALVFIQNRNDPYILKKRMIVTKKILKNKISTIELEVIGKSAITRLMYAIYVGDYISYYLALMNKVDPTPVPLVEDFKLKLKR